MLRMAIVGVVLLLALLLLALRYRSGTRTARVAARTMKAKSAPTTTRVADSVHTGNAPGIHAQVLHVPNPDRACEAARHYIGRTLDAATSPSLPLPGCGVVECRCRYERIANRRGEERRESTDRREEIRFHSTGDRRKNPDKRHGNRFWDRFGRR